MSYKDNRIHSSIITLISDRGYIIPDKYKKPFSERYEIPEDIIEVYTNKNKENLLLMYISPNKKTKQICSGPFRVFVAMMLLKKAKNGILLTKYPIRNKIKELNLIFENAIKISFFEITELIISPKKNFFQFTQLDILNEDEKIKLFNDLSIINPKSELPYINMGEFMSKWYDIKEGEIVRIIYTNKIEYKYVLK